jgi:protein-S-isoprenylcysteine O-methyltransferase Ste14
MAIPRWIHYAEIAPPVWAIIYTLAAGGITHLSAAGLIPGLPLVPLAGILIVAGVGIAVSAALLFRRHGTEINPTSATNRVLVTFGPYRFSRNPMYLGLVLVTVGVAFWIGAWPMFLPPIAVFATANWVHIPFEETKMMRQFGAAFESYTSRVRRWI